MLLKAVIAGLTMYPATNTPIVILKTEEGDQAVPIWIGLLEATSIASALQKVQFAPDQSAYDCLIGEKRWQEYLQEIWRD